MGLAMCPEVSPTKGNHSLLHNRQHCAVVGVFQHLLDEHEQGLKETATGDEPDADVRCDPRQERRRHLPECLARSGAEQGLAAALDTHTKRMAGGSLLAEAML